METKLTLKMQQSLVMTPVLQQAIKLLQLSKLELVQLVRQQILENPVLEEIEVENEPLTSDDPSNDFDIERENIENEEVSEFDIDWENYLDNHLDLGYTEERSESVSFENIISKKVSLADYLLWQLRLSCSCDLEEEIGTILVGDIDEDGYLRIPLEEIAQMGEVSIEVVGNALKLIQSFEPVGIGARDLKECLLIQLSNLEHQCPLAEKIVETYLINFQKANYGKIAKELGIGLEEVVEAAEIVSALEPKPGRKFDSEEAWYIIPDVFIYKIGNDYVVVLNEEGLPRLRINSFYRRMLNKKAELSKKVQGYVEKKLSSAIWLIKSIEQRQRTIYRVTKSIVKFQREFLEKGAAYLKPLILKEIAADISMHESTVSRVTTNKYVHTPQGLFELKYFFSGSLGQTDGGEISSTIVKEMIKKIILRENADKPYNDQKIVDILREEKGVKITRRTIAKYRSLLNILPASRRKK